MTAEPPARPLPHDPLPTVATLARRTGRLGAGKIGIARRGSFDAVVP
jgi:hypothetical protein